MKTTLYLLALLTAAVTAQEANPFLNQPAKEAPAGETGDTFIELAEHIVVPADLLDGWLAEHPMKGDASGLRRVAQTWVEEGKAKLDHTALVTGTVGRDCSSESILEQIYATEYEPAEPEEWTQPTSFETRNIGYSLEGGAGQEKGKVTVYGDVSAVRMLPNRAWSALAEKTRKPTDVFIPRFRSIRVSQAPLPTPKHTTDPFGEMRDNDIVWQPDEDEAASDPFSSPAPLPPRETMPRFSPGKTYLAIRADDDLPLPVDPADPSPDSMKAPDLPANRPVRLIFFRAEVAGKASPTTQLQDNYTLTARLVTVEQKTLSEMLQKHELASIAGDAWTSIKGTTFRQVSGTCHTGAKGIVEDVVEVTYPTEWEPAKRIPAADGQPARREPSTPTSYETRNTGITMESAIIDDPKGSLLKLSLEQVIHGGNSVHHRILSNDEWKPDVIFPIMVSFRWRTQLRVNPGAWMFVGSGGALDAAGRFDPSRAVLAFVKVE
jgi:hypothetical protein